MGPVSAVAPPILLGIQLSPYNLIQTAVGLDLRLQIDDCGNNGVLESKAEGLLCVGWNDGLDDPFGHGRRLCVLRLDEDKRQVPIVSYSRIKKKTFLFFHTMNENHKQEKKR